MSCIALNSGVGHLSKSHPSRRVLGVTGVHIRVTGGGGHGQMRNKLRRLLCLKMVLVSREVALF